MSCGDPGGREKRADRDDDAKMSQRQREEGSLDGLEDWYLFQHLFGDASFLPF